MWSILRNWLKSKILKYQEVQNFAKNDTEKCWTRCRSDSSIFCINAKTCTFRYLDEFFQASQLQRILTCSSHAGVFLFIHQILPVLYPGLRNAAPGLPWGSGNTGRMEEGDNYWMENKKTLHKDCLTSARVRRSTLRWNGCVMYQKYIVWASASYIFLMHAFSRQNISLVLPDSEAVSTSCAELYFIWSANIIENHTAKSVFPETGPRYFNNPSL